MQDPGFMWSTAALTIENMATMLTAKVRSMRARSSSVMSWMPVPWKLALFTSTWQSQDAPHTVCPGIPLESC